MSKFITSVLTDKKYRLIWLITSIVITGLLALLIVFLPFLGDDSKRTMTLWEYDSMRVAYVIWVAIFASIFYVIIAKTRLQQTVEDLSIVQAILRILPIPPLVGAWIFTILPFIQTHDQAYYFTLGSDFMIANYMDFIDATSVDDIVALGEELTYAIGFYLLLVFLIVTTIHYLMIVIWSVRPGKTMTSQKG